MKERHAAIAVGCVFCLLVGAVGGRSLGVGDAEASSTYDQATATQERSALLRQIDVLEGELARSKQEREELAKTLGESGPALDLAGALETAQSKLKALESDLQTMRAKAEQSLEQGKALAKRELDQLRREKTRIERNARTESARWRKENVKLQQEVRSLRDDVKTLNSTLRTLKSLPFGR